MSPDSRQTPRYLGRSPPDRVSPCVKYGVGPAESACTGQPSRRKNNIGWLIRVGAARCFRVKMMAFGILNASESMTREGGFFFLGRVGGGMWLA